MIINFLNNPKNYSALTFPDLYDSIDKGTDSNAAIFSLQFTPF